MGKLWPSSSEQMDDVHLVDNAHAERGPRRSTRPDSLSGLVHEILLVLVAAFIGASFLLLQRATLVITDTVRHSLQLPMSDVAWMSSSSG